MQKFEGRYCQTGFDSEKRNFSINEIQQFLNNGHHGSLQVTEYTINGHIYKSVVLYSLSIDKNNSPKMLEDKIILPTFFQRIYLEDSFSGNPHEAIPVDVIISPEHIDFVNIYKD
jgi:hypothetical protein